MSHPINNSSWDFVHIGNHLKGHTLRLSMVYWLCILFIDPHRDNLITIGFANKHHHVLFCYIQYVLVCGENITVLLCWIMQMWGVRDPSIGSFFVQWEKSDNVRRNISVFFFLAQINTKDLFICIKLLSTLKRSPYGDL